MSAISDPIQEYWLRPDLHAALEDSVRGILQHPELQNINLVALGESPALLSTIAKPAIEARGNSVTFVPFSGFRFTQQHKDEILGRKTVQIDRKPSNVRAYRRFLEAQGISPKQIIENFRRHGIKTTFFDVPAGGGSAGVFMQLMMDWAGSRKKRRELLEVTQILFLKEAEEAPRELYFPKYDVAIRPVVVEPGQFMDAYFEGQQEYLHSITNFVLHGPPREEPDGKGRLRVLPYYDHSLWNKPPAPVTGLHRLNAEAALAAVAPLAEKLKEEQAAGIVRRAATLVIKEPLPADFSPAPGTVTAENLGGDIALVAFDGKKLSVVRFVAGAITEAEIEQQVAALNRQFDPAKTSLLLIGGKGSTYDEIRGDRHGAVIKTSDRIVWYLRHQLHDTPFHIDCRDIMGDKPGRTVHLDPSGRLHVTHPPSGLDNYSIDLNDWHKRRAALMAHQAPEAKIMDSTGPHRTSQGLPDGPRPANPPELKSK